jgi:predicted RecA/RadA family phage recombinase
MSEGIYRHNGDEIHIGSAAAAYLDGTVQKKGGMAGLVEGNVAIGDPYNLRIKGMVELACATGTTLAEGVLVDWDDTTNLVVATTTGTFSAGRLAFAKVSGQLTAWVLLNER